MSLLRHRCDSCRRWFETEYPWKKFCSDRCRHDAYNLRRKILYNAHSSIRAKAKEKDLARRDIRYPQREHVCEWCGETYLTRRSRQKYCTKAHQVQARLERRRQRRLHES